jgi:ATP-binding cassette subfamily B protein
VNLLFQVPKSAEAIKDIKFCLPFDLDKSTKKVDGNCIVTSSEILVYVDDDLVKSYNISDFDEIECEQLIGCSMLVGKSNDSSELICAFTQRYFIRYAELSKVLEFYKRTGKLLTETGEDEPNCPKCGMPLNGARVCPYCSDKSQVLIKLVKRTLPYKRLFLVALFCTISMQILGLIMPYIKRIFVDEYIVPLNADLPNFIKISLVLIGSLVLSWLLEWLNMRATFKMALSVGRDLRIDVFSKTQQLSMSNISKRTAGELINRVSRDAMKLQDFIAANGKDAIVQVFSFIILSVLLCVINIKLALLVLVPVPIIVYFNIKLFNLMSIRYGAVWRKENRHSSVLHDILNGIRVVKSYGSEKREVEKYNQVSKEAAGAIVSADTLWFLTIPFSEYILTSGNFFILYFGGKMVLGHQLSLGELIQYTSYVAMIYRPLRWLIRIPRLLAETSISAHRVFEVLDERTDVGDKKEAIDLDIKGNITFDDVYFGYKVYNPVLKAISCNIAQGEMIGIVGHSGVGKSTMINLILRLYDCTQGKLMIDGVDIKDISQHSLRSQVGVVLQETFLFDGSVYDNIAYAKPDATFEQIVSAAKIANAHDFIVRLPDGYNTRVGDKGFSLSGGERQRIAIARAIIHNPKIIILDEATASLDTQTEKQIQEALGKLTKGRTTIAIAHRLSTLSNADRLIVLDKGKLAEIGTHDELMRKCGVYYKLVMAQRQTTKMKK